VKCSEFLHELTDYLDGVIDAPTKSELEEHLAWCHNCYVVCDTTKKTIEIYRDSQLRNCYQMPVQKKSRTGRHHSIKPLCSNGLLPLQRASTLSNPLQES